jgi:hypothetical protein
LTCGFALKLGHDSIVDVERGLHKETHIVDMGIWLAVQRPRRDLRVSLIPEVAPRCGERKAGVCVSSVSVVGGCHADLPDRPRVDQIEASCRRRRHGPVTAAVVLKRGPWSRTLLTVLTVFSGSYFRRGLHDEP